MSEVGVGAAESGVRTVHRFEVRTRGGSVDARGERVRRDAEGVGVRPTRVRTARVYLIAGDFDSETAERIGAGLLADPVLEEVTLGASAPEGELIEVHPLPGVMDPAAQTVAAAALELVGRRVEVVTGWRYDVEGVSGAEADRLARRLLANEVVESVHRSAWTPCDFPHAAPADQSVRRVEVRGLDDAGLERLSREGHLFLSLDEMRAIRDEFDRLGREPTDVELETLAQTWSEHCVHKTLKSTIRYRGGDLDGDVIDWRGRPGHEVLEDGTVVISNLLASTVAAATHELIRGGCDWTLSVFVDNAGVIEFDGEHAVCVKVETHNHPSAIEPYGGAATGIGGVIRDIMGTGLGARPIANTDVFCVASPDMEEVPAGCLHPRRVLGRVVDGVRDYGNRMGIPTVNGAVWFDDRFVGNPLVFAGCVGVMPRSMVGGEARPGDRIIALGGRTGRDGIHGATFSSAELEEGHSEEFGHAVQIGNAIEEKRTLDALMRARDAEGGCLYSAVTDCGAGGFSSAVGEMGERVGAEVELSGAPLKYRGLRYDEIWISESQERMVLAVPAENVARLRAICEEEHVEVADLGVFGSEDEEGGARLVLRYGGVEVGCLSMAFVHDGIPMPTREAVWGEEGEASRHQGIEASREEKGKGSRHRGIEASGEEGGIGDIDVKATVLGLLSRPNVASRRWIVRQYDHEVQGNTVVKPLVGPLGVGPGDAAVVQPVAGSSRGLAIGCGLSIPAGDPAEGGDPYVMALAAVDECVRNLVCVGADPGRIAILDNFCWASCAKAENLGALVRAAEGCYDAAKAYGTPFVSGKDSLNNQFRTESGAVIEIPPTLLITGIGVVEDVGRCVTMDLKPRATGSISVLGCHAATLGGSEYSRMRGERGDERGRFDLKGAARAARTVATLIREGYVLAAHDCSEGGLAVAVAEMALAGDVGVEVDLDELMVRMSEGDARRAWFGECAGMYVIQTVDLNELEPDRVDRMGEILRGSLWSRVGRVLKDERVLRAPAYGLEIPLEEARAAHLGTLDW